MLTKQERIKIGKEVFDKLIDSEYDSNEKIKISNKYSISMYMVNKCFYEYRDRCIEPKPTKEDIEKLDKMLSLRRRNITNKKYEDNFALNVGKEIFDEVIKNEYASWVIPNIAKKYGITVDAAKRLFYLYKNRDTEPKPSSEDLALLTKYAFNNTTKTPIPADIVITMLGASDEELKSYLEKYTLDKLLFKIGYYKVRNTYDRDSLENLEKRLKTINDSVVYSSSNSNGIVLFETVINEYLSGNDYYPNYIFAKYNVSKSVFNSWIRTIKNNKDYNEINLYNNFISTMKNREMEFSCIVRDLCNMIDNDINILDFYRLTHITINRFKSYMNLCLNNHLITNDEYNKVNNFFDYYIVGSYSLKDLDEAYSIVYEYNGVSLSKEEIKNICYELVNENIPVTKNSIVLLFEEKVKKMNKTL